MTHCLIVVYKCITFQLNSFNSVQLTERTRNCIYLCYKGNNLNNIHAGVMALVLDTSSRCASYRADGHDFVTDGQTDRQTHRQRTHEKKNNMSPDSRRGGGA